MAKFIEVTDGGITKLVNVDMICYVSDCVNHAAIRLRGNEWAFSVDETYEEIKAMLEEVNG
ncbi:hypothetical protein [uncultured Gilliamella sp.]|uniref:hypothetical protein n=1 Tax=uncultured Gilliamella sp. TaxID=1193505 RepID=UPI0025EC0DA4|nr:hypothetical protein [uncultured Gilliamella sp.]